MSNILTVDQVKSTVKAGHERKLWEPTEHLFNYIELSMLLLKSWTYKAHMTIDCRVLKLKYKMQQKISPESFLFRVKDNTF